MSIPVAKQYIKDFEQLGLGVFVHFGLYSILEYGEWAADQRPGLTTVDDYRKLMEQFNPDDMEEMVKEIAVSGAKYITFTTRHHDGFSLYDTKGLSDFDSVHALAGRDLVREFVDACHKYDIVPVFYHTTMEWWHPDFDDNFDRYLQYLRDSVEVLCTNYGKIGGLWFDGNWRKSGEGDFWQEDKLYSLIRKHQPDAMIINNTGLDACGATGHPELDSVTFERGNPAPINREGMAKYVTGEVCDSINNHWGIADDINYKSPKAILETLCNCRASGANYLFNVGPDKTGHIPAMPKAMLEVIGFWMNKFGEAIYNGRPFWYEEGTKNFVLKDDKHAYFFCFDLARRGSENVTYAGGRDGDFQFNNFSVEVENIRWMDNDEVLDFKKDGNTLTVHFSGYDYGSDYCVRVAKGDLK